MLVVYLMQLGSSRPYTELISEKMDVKLMMMMMMMMYDCSSLTNRRRSLFQLLTAYLESGFWIRIQDRNPVKSQI